MFELWRVLFKQGVIFEVALTFDEVSLVLSFVVGDVSFSSSVSSRPASPGLLSNLSKRLNTSAELLITRCENGTVSIGINLNLSTRDLGIRGVPEIEPQQDLSSLVADSPFERVLSRSKWIEFPRCQRLPEDWDNIISGCWVEKPLLNYATAVLFAGCVLYNPQNKKAVLCLVAESYGRGRDVDVHAEKPICIGEGVSSISQPSTSGLYPHATVCRIQHDKKDHRLVLGCKTFNVLFTEVWRLDKDCSSERAFTAGSCSSAFPLVGNEKVRIFIDERSFNLASDVASGKYVPRFQIDYLRQIRSHLCSAHSYRMGRASCPLLWNMVSAQPATIFSLSMVRPGSGDGPLVSSLLSRMAKDVNLNGRNAVLQKDELLDVLGGVVDGQAFHVYLCKILTLFGDKDEINILANDSSVGLEKLLGLLAGCMSSALYSCNRDVVVPMVRQELFRLSW
ncbi:hypothetical protein BC939DRAFT_495579 [Gamsiella multidivaricata]|uniref:uncharacterized protein n=1 Tax=Gamsiella multidivaricata TaxID=101098 RepID=UPI00222089E7|nr:uncharacterized protein BC939DRAFT_495579 [Gamsiella multidivaricata]KAI7819030.1 hypothetical protein BC939DRAFT_495579 [Gamsiella multidivaricata]